MADDTDTRSRWRQAAADGLFEPVEAPPHPPIKSTPWYEIRPVFVLALLTIGCVVHVFMSTPNLLRSRGCNETAARCTMLNVASAQVKFFGSTAADTDGDGLGEYGGFIELSGEGQGRMDELIPQPVLSGAFRVLNANGEVARSGYYFRVFLPGVSGQAIGEPQTGFRAEWIDADKAELSWCVYAWPVNYGQSGRRTFFIGATGEVLATEDERYSGTGRGPAAKAAYAEVELQDPIAKGIKGLDGNIWTPLD